MGELYTTHDISRLLQVDPSTISKWIDRGLLVAFRTPGGHRRVRAADLRTFLIAHQMPVPDELGSGDIRLLAVSADKGVLDAIKRTFKAQGEKVQLLTTPSGVEATLMLNEQRPHGLLIDLELPEFDTLELLRRVSARKALEGVKLIAMSSAPSRSATADEALKAGAVVCLEKPPSPERVLELFRVPLALGGRTSR